MSLRPDDRSSRGRDRPSNRDRSRSRSNVRVSSPPSNASYGYAPPPPSSSASARMPGSFDDEPSYEVRAPTQPERSPYYPQTSSAPSQYYAPPPVAPYPRSDNGFTMGGYTDLPPHERPGYNQNQQRYQPPPPPPRRKDDERDSEDSDDDDDDDGQLAYGESATVDRNRGRHDSYRPHPNGQPLHNDQNQYKGQPQGYPPYNGQPPYSIPPGSPSRSSSYTYKPSEVKPGSRMSSYNNYQYAPTPEKVSYSARPQTGQHSMSYDQSSHGPPREQIARTHSLDYNQNAHFTEIIPDSEKHDRKSVSSKHRLSVGTQQPGMQDLSLRPNRLSVSGDRPDPNNLGGMPPPSPMLEAYQGTWQSLPPMPLALRPLDDDDLDMLEPLGSQPKSRSSNKKGDKLSRDAHGDRGEKKRVKLYDPEDDAKVVAKALGSSKLDANTLIDVFPPLSHDQVWELRKEYKKQVKIQGKGINLPKHLKMKMTGNFGKVVYVNALGRYESEGYWANFFYQSHGSRRELLIEALMGRTNMDIKYIKEEFKDKRYSDDLEKCMERELKPDKFRTAILMALEARRQEEQDIYPQEYRNRDVDTLYRALNARQGGETAMLEIIVRRSDAHLREVLRTYERLHGENFARAALRKSNNLVGEVIAHILNGVINKPARDALLLHHAIKDIAEKNKDDDLRYELLISRLVRLHWDKMHLMRVKKEYVEKYRKELQEDIEDATKGDFREYLCELCEVRAGV
nr:annexin a11 [Quercus suber]